MSNSIVYPAYSQKATELGNFIVMAVFLTSSDALSES